MRTIAATPAEPNRGMRCGMNLSLLKSTEAALVDLASAVSAMLVNLLEEGKDKVGHRRLTELRPCQVVSHGSELPQ